MRTAKRRWRQRLRRQIAEEAKKARDSVNTAHKMALRKTALVHKEGDPLPRERELSLVEEIEFLGFSLQHMQEAENHFGQLRVLLKGYLERLQNDHEIVLAHGPEILAIEFTSKPKKTRPGRKEMRPAIERAWAEDIAEFGEPVTKGGRRLAYARVGRTLNVSGDTVRRYLNAERKELV